MMSDPSLIDPNAQFKDIANAASLHGNARLVLQHGNGGANGYGANGDDDDEADERLVG